MTGWECLQAVVEMTTGQVVSVYQQHVSLDDLTPGHCDVIVRAVNPLTAGHRLHQHRADLT